MVSTYQVKVKELSRNFKMVGVSFKCETLGYSNCHASIQFVSSFKYHKFVIYSFLSLWQPQTIWQQNDRREEITSVFHIFPMCYNKSVIIVFYNGLKIERWLHVFMSQLRGISKKCTKLGHNLFITAKLY